MFTYTFLISCSRTVGLALWKVANEDPNHEYCNEIPGKLASPARLQNARVNEDSVIQTNSNQMIKDGNISQVSIIETIFTNIPM